MSEDAATFYLDIRSQVVVVLAEHGGVLEGLQYNGLDLAPGVYHADPVGVLVSVGLEQENVLQHDERVEDGRQEVTELTLPDGVTS